MNSVLVKVFICHTFDSYVGVAYMGQSVLLNWFLVNHS